MCDRRLFPGCGESLEICCFFVGGLRKPQMVRRAGVFHKASQLFPPLRLFGPNL